MEALSAEAPIYIEWAFVVVALVPARGAPVMPRVARLVMRPDAKLVKAWVAALMRTSLCKAMVLLACVFSRARLNSMSGASVPAVNPVSAPPMSEKSAAAPLVRAAEFTATVPVAVMPATVTFPETSASPCTERDFDGEVVPTPTLPPPVANHAPPDEVMAVVEA